MRYTLNTKKRSLLKLLVGLAMISMIGAGCSDDDDSNNNTADTGVQDTGSDTGDNMDPDTDDNMDPDTGDNMDPDTGDNMDPDTGDNMDPDTGDNMDPDTGDNMNPGFTFSTGNPVDNAEDFAQIDRVGMPAVSTALITGGNKTAYNEASPTADATLQFATDLLGSVAGLHSSDIDIDSDLEGAGLDPCTMDDPPSPAGQCVSQPIVTDGPTAVDLIVPDTLTINVEADPGFPNGRKLADPVINATLAIVLLDMTADDGSGNAQTPFYFTASGPGAGLLNPTENDVAFPGSFPYLAEAQ